ncbi:hypothetical protein FOZ60_003748 [Perkinsus olseni]|uniref:Copper transporter n=1 Tax=Perkinsus olseni TaxID=32597 RepID=A0A7J6PIH1_PEROL|nr:hypothetical protein FOZ60_003748 [Perkinsus olseni]
MMATTNHHSLLLGVCCCCFLLIGRVIADDVPQVLDISVSDLGASIDRVQEAITTQGVFTLTGLPTPLTTAYHTLAYNLPRCGTEKDGRTERLGDGTLRTTYAQKSMHASPRFLQSSGCPSGVTDAVNYIRSELDHLGVEVARALDKVLTFDSHTVSLGGGDVGSVEDIITQGENSHLDHIHVYTKDLSDPEDIVVQWEEKEAQQQQQQEEEDGHTNGVYDDTLTLHTDQGVFLLLILPPGDSNFYYEDGTSSKQVPLNIPSSAGGDGGMRVVVLMGNTLKSFIGTTPSVRPLPHAVRMGVTSTPRLVFGRMFLLPAAFKSPIPALKSMTFKQWTQAALIPRDDDSEEIAFARRRLAGECKAGEIYCWMQCMANTCSGVNEMPVCWDTATNELCPTHDGLHHKTCGVGCAVKPGSGGGVNPVSPTPDPNAFCTGSTAMFMDGFNWMRGPSTQCVILFTRSWVLDTAWKFALGCIGVLFLGMLVEGILWARRRYLGYIRNKWAHAIIGALAFGISVSIAYLAMLVVMTYSCELFLCLCAGLVIGHFVFGNVRQRIGESADPCCGDTTVVSATAAAGGGGGAVDPDGCTRRCSSDCAGQRLVLKDNTTCEGCSS